MEAEPRHPINGPDLISFELHMFSETGMAGVWNKGKYKRSAGYVCVLYFISSGPENVFVTAEILLVKICLLNIA